ncbi:MAG: ABC transporter substrate-binding protein [Bdellovibrionaceae bacterium]|nr:ABC transporter substrate-binding protein [Pseudobdellovibrionaceae bacterium]
MRILDLKSKLLLGRLLTRSGDQAWDFAVPLVLLKLFPDQLRIAAFYYFLVRLAGVLILPKLASQIDRMNRFSAAKLGIFLQLVGVILGAASIAGFYFVIHGELAAPLAILFISLVFGGILANLGSTFMDIAIANDLVPSGLAEAELTSFNSRLRQVDLLTEVGAPVIAGLLLLVDQPNLLAGFILIALWNVVSFFPELVLLKSVFNERPDLITKKVQTSEQAKTALWSKLTHGWRAFFREPIALAALAYSILWLSVLSPHGVLLTAYLKDGWQLPEWAIGAFRGGGAFFGLIATAIFPWAIRRWGLLNGTRNFIIYQTATVLIALAFFFSGGIAGQVGFLVFILLSRVGLYGFSLGETQIRQVGISPETRGEVNGFASALTGIATLVLYGAGALLPSTQDFQFLVIGSALFVALACAVYLVWLRVVRSDPKISVFS